MTAKHGTYAGWNQHMTNRTPVCMDCREAARQYHANRRKRDPEAYRREKDRDNARLRALWRLAAMHPGDFARLTAEEVSKAEQATGRKIRA